MTRALRSADEHEFFLCPFRTEPVWQSPSTPALFVNIARAQIFFCLLITGCSAVQTLSLRDAETLPAGELSTGGGLSLSPNLYVVHDQEGKALSWTLDPSMFWQIRQGVTDDLDIGGTMWASNIPFFSLAWGSFDLGLRAEGTWMATERVAPGKLAVVVDVGGYGTGVGALTIRETPHRGVALIGLGGGGLLYSRALGSASFGRERATMTIALRAEFATGHFQFDPTPLDSTAGRLTIERSFSGVLLLPSLSFRLSGGLVIDVGGMGARSPWTDRTEWTAHGGISILPEK